MTQNIVIVDYGIGNLFNVQQAFAAVGAKTIISAKPEEVVRADKLVLPGVGAFEAGMKHLRANGMIEAVLEVAGKGRPFLGICLGMQLLLDESEENGRWEGLKLVAGKVLRFTPPKKNTDFKIPQICWNKLSPPKGRDAGKFWQGTLLQGLSAGSEMYFVNSYYVRVADENHELAETAYGLDTFTSVLKKDNITGCQFHPERSGHLGLKILENFVAQK